MLCPMRDMRGPPPPLDLQVVLRGSEKTPNMPSLRRSLPDLQNPRPRGVPQRTGAMKGMLAAGVRRRGSGIKQYFGHRLLVAALACYRACGACGGVGRSVGRVVRAGGVGGGFARDGVGLVAALPSWRRRAGGGGGGGGGVVGVACDDGGLGGHPGGAGARPVGVYHTRGDPHRGAAAEDAVGSRFVVLARCVRRRLERPSAAARALHAALVADAACDPGAGFAKRAADAEARGAALSLLPRLRGRLEPATALAGVR